MSVITPGLSYRIAGTDLTITIAPPAEPARPVPVTVTIDEHPRDRLLFDSGAARGLNEAAIPFAGTVLDAEGAPLAGAVVEGRLVPASGGPATGWQRLGETDAHGRYAGEALMSRHPDYLRREVRVAGHPEVTAAAAGTCGVGHVIAIWGQSNVAQWHHPSHGRLYHHPAPTFGDGSALQDEMVQVAYDQRDGQGLRHVHLTGDDHVTDTVGAFGTALMRARPGEKWAVAFQTVSGTGYRSLVDDGDPKRDWACDLAIHRLITGEGLTHVGLAFTRWNASPGAFAENYVRAFLPIFIGREHDGTPVEIPGPVSYTEVGGRRANAVYHADHAFTELYDYDRTRWTLAEPARHQNGAYSQFLVDKHGPRTGPRLYGGVFLQETAFRPEGIRLAMRAAKDQPVAVDSQGRPVFLECPLTPLSIRFGELNGDPREWRDIAHLSADHPDGFLRRAAIDAVAICTTMGLAVAGRDLPAPVFDRSEFQADGRYAEFWCSGGPVSTVRRERGGAHPTLRPHHAEVQGFTINHASAHRAEVVEGRVRVYPNEGTFSPLDTIRYGEAGANAVLEQEEGSSRGRIADTLDMALDLYLDTPILKVPGTILPGGLEGLDMRPMPEAALLAVPAGVPADGQDGAGGDDGGPTDGDPTDGDPSDGDPTDGDPTDGDPTDGGPTDGVAPHFSRGQSSEPFFEGPQLGEGVAGLTVEMEARLGVQDGYGGRALVQVRGGVMTVVSDTRANKRSLSVSLKAVDGSVAVNASAGPRTLPLDWCRVRVSILLDRGDGTGRVVVHVDDAVVIDQGFEARDAVLPPWRQVRLLGSEIPVDVRALRVWHEADALGGRPAASPVKEISGDAAIANADSWFGGTGRFT